MAYLFLYWSRIGRILDGSEKIRRPQHHLPRRAAFGPYQARPESASEPFDHTTAVPSSPLHVCNDLCGAGVIAGIQGIKGGAGKGGFRTEQPAQEDDAVLVGNLG